jgi:hypothetical protein
MPLEVLRAFLDPTAPWPTGWPTGIVGAFLVFVLPVSVGIPVGILMAAAGGASPALTALLYLLADLVEPIVLEPVTAVARRFLPFSSPIVAHFRVVLDEMTERAGIRGGGRRGPIKLFMLGLAFGPLTARIAAAAAGRGRIAAWTLAIAGDVAGFLLIMASTLWLNSVLNDQRMTLGIMVVTTLVVPMVLQRARRRDTPGTFRRRAPATFAIGPETTPPARNAE